MVCRDTLRIKHLPKELTDAQKEDFVRHFGAYKVKVITSKAKAKSIVYAKFENEDVAKSVMVRLHQISILNCRLCVEYAETDILRGQLTAQRVDELRDAPDKRFFKNFINSINAFNDSVGFYQPPPSHLKYNYPKANRPTINNIAHALATVPRFYTQVLHLMNKMNLPPPFAMPEPVTRTVTGVQHSQPLVTPNTKTPSEKRKAPPSSSSSSSSESELESDGEENKNKEIIPQKRVVTQKKPLKRPKFIKQPLIPASASSKPAELAENVFEKVEVQPQRKIELKVIQEPVAKKAEPTREISIPPEKKNDPIFSDKATKADSKAPEPVKQVKAKTPEKAIENRKAQLVGKTKASEDIHKKAVKEGDQKKVVKEDVQFDKTEPVIAQQVKEVHKQVLVFDKLEESDSACHVVSEELINSKAAANNLQLDASKSEHISENTLQKEKEITLSTPQKPEVVKKVEIVPSTPHKPKAVKKVEIVPITPRKPEVVKKVEIVPSTPYKSEVVKKVEIVPITPQKPEAVKKMEIVPNTPQKPEVVNKEEIHQEPKQIEPWLPKIEIEKPIHEPNTEIPAEPSSEDEFPCISLEELAANQVTDLTVMPVFKNYNPGEPTNKLYIKNCAKTVVVQDLEYIYNRYREDCTGGKPSEFNIRLMREGRMKGQAFVTLDSVEQAQKAVKETNGFILKDKPLVVVFGKAGKKK